MEIKVRIANGIRLLEDAFPIDPLPPPIPPRPQNIEVEDCYEAFSGPWTELGNKVLWVSCLSFLDNEVIAYYMPAFLRAMLRSVGSKADDTWQVLYDQVLMHLHEQNALYFTPFLTQRQGDAIYETLCILDAWLRSIDVKGIDDEDLAFWRNWSSES